jgi:hypothetical protein
VEVEHIRVRKCPALHHPAALPELWAGPFNTNATELYELRKDNKHLEAKVAELTDKYECNTAIMHARTAKMNEYAEKLTRAEAVIEKCLDVIAWVDKYVSCAINGSIKEALAAITEYREGK